MQTEIKELKNKLKAVLKDPKQQPEALNLLLQLIEKLKQNRVVSVKIKTQKMLHIIKLLQVVRGIFQLTRRGI